MAISKILKSRSCKVPQIHYLEREKYLELKKEILSKHSSLLEEEISLISYKGKILAVKILE